MVFLGICFTVVVVLSQLCAFFYLWNCTFLMTINSMRNISACQTILSVLKLSSENDKRKLLIGTSFHLSQLRCLSFISFFPVASYFHSAIIFLLFLYFSFFSLCYFISLQTKIFTWAHNPTLIYFCFNDLHPKWNHIFYSLFSLSHWLVWDGEKQQKVFEHFSSRYSIVINSLLWICFIASHSYIFIWSLNISFFHGVKKLVCSLTFR